MSTQTHNNRMEKQDDDDHDDHDRVKNENAITTVRPQTNALLPLLLLLSHKGVLMRVVCCSAIHSTDYRLQSIEGREEKGRVWSCAPKAI